MDEADETPGASGRSGGRRGATSQPTTDQVRIAAVEAAVAAGLSEPNADAAAGDVPSADPGEAPDEQPDSGATAVPELPDWVDPPTGQVPRVLLEGASEEAAGSALGVARGPTWREHAADWDDDLGLGPLEEAADETTTVAGRAPDELLENPFDFGELDGDFLSGSPEADPPAAPGASDGDGKPGGELDDDAWAAFASGTSGPVGWMEPGERRHAASRRAPRTPRRPRASGEPRRPEPAAATAAAQPASEAVDDGRTEAPVSRRSPLVATATGVVAGAIALGCFLGGAVSALTLVTVVTTLAAGEAFGALRRSGRRPATLVGLCAVAALVVGAYLHGPIAVPVVVACGVAVSAIWYLAQAAEPPGSPGLSSSPASDLGATLLVVTWVGVPAAFAGLLLSPARFPDRHGVAYVLAAVLLTVAHDVGSYAAGATLGRHRVLPRVSPNKTLEGLAGGTVLTFVTAIGVGHIHPIALGTAVGLAALVSLLGPLGDLTESLVKRDLGVKDMGRVLPAHGGFFDRVDAMLFVLPAAYFLFRVAHPS